MKATFNIIIMHLHTHLKSARAVLVHLFSKNLDNMVIIMVWDPSICFCCCCSCWPVNFIMASFFSASCATLAFSAPAPLFKIHPTFHSSPLDTPRYCFHLIFFPSPFLHSHFFSFCLPASPLPSFSLSQHLSYLS